MSASSPQNDTKQLFAGTLARLRREAGFATAYQFYHRNGGRRHFPFTYVHYMRFERGVSLPRPEWLGLLLVSLRLSPGQAATREFFTAFLASELGSQEAFDLVVGPLLGKADGAPAPTALGWVKAEHTVHLTPEQFRTIASDEATYWCSEILANDSGSWSAAEAAQTLGLSAKAAAAGFAALKKAGLAREASKGRYKAAAPGKIYTFPGRLAGQKPLLERIETYWRRMHARRGDGVLERVELVRAESASARAYAASLSEAVDAANAYATRAQSPTTGLFLIESRIRKLASF